MDHMANLFGGRFHGGLLLVATFRRSCHPDLYTGPKPNTFPQENVGICGKLQGYFQLLCFDAFESLCFLAIKTIGIVKNGNPPTCHVKDFITW